MRRHVFHSLNSCDICSTYYACRIFQLFFRLYLFAINKQKNQEKLEEEIRKRVPIAFQFTIERDVWVFLAVYWCYYILSELSRGKCI
jgi:hypothetical protein